MHIAAAMSGGVDSTTAAALLLRQGHRVTGMTMRLWDGIGPSPPRRCCSREDIEAAARMAKLLGIPHQVVDFQEPFLEKVVRRFCDEYLEGLTPNPCVVCNEIIKAGLLLEHARSIGAEAVATGHYARIEKGPEGARLLKGADPAKDQSYFLHRIGPESLRRVVFPLGELRKEHVRAVARELGLAVASKAESQEVCFVPAEGYTGTVERFGSRRPVRGVVVYRGKVLFEHEGIHRFTVGQRCGSGRGPGRRIFVRSIDPSTGRIEAADREDLFFSSMTVRDVVWHVPPPRRPLDAQVKIRYRSAAASAAVEALDDGRASVRFAEPHPAVAPGQAAVFYIGDAVAGGGWIEKGVNHADQAS
jgi:tRNA-specific 2-thiouridylase